MPQKTHLQSHQPQKTLDMNRQSLAVGNWGVRFLIDLPDRSRKVAMATRIRRLEVGHLSQSQWALPELIVVCFGWFWARSLPFPPVSVEEQTSMAPRPSRQSQNPPLQISFAIPA
jgi:hypothetical protein